MDLNSFPGHLLQEDLFGGPYTSLSPPHLTGALRFTVTRGWTLGKLPGLPFGSVTTGPRYAIRLVKSAANISNVKVKRTSFKNIVIILKSQCSLVAVIASQSNSTETCLTTENGLRKSLSLLPTVLALSVWEVPVAPQKGDPLWLLGDTPHLFSQKEVVAA